MIATTSNIADKLVIEVCVIWSLPLAYPLVLTKSVTLAYQLHTSRQLRFRPIQNDSVLAYPILSYLSLIKIFCHCLFLVVTVCHYCWLSLLLVVIIVGCHFCRLLLLLVVIVFHCSSLPFVEVFCYCVSLAEVNFNVCYFL